MVAADRARILLIADVPDWIFARHCRALIDRLSDEFAFTVAFQGEPFAEDDFDLIYPLEWNLLAPDRIRRPGKYLTGIRSHSSWNAHEFEPFAAFLRDAFQRVHVVSRRLHRLLDPFVPGLVRLGHGVDTRFFAPDADTAASAAPRAATRLRVGWAGNRAADGKGLDILEQFASVPDVELVTCGYRQRHLTLDEMRRFYASLDVYACASRQEGHNNALMEAAAMEVAIVTTDNGTVPEYLQHGESALIVEREYPAFLTAVRELADPRTRRALGKAARHAVVRHFDWDVVAAGYRELFRSALAGAPHAPVVTSPLCPPPLVAAVNRTHAAPHAAAAADIAPGGSGRDDLRRATLLVDAARSIVPIVLSRRVAELVVYGAGEAGRALAEALAWHGVRVSAFVDSNPAKIGTRVGEIAVISLEDAFQRGATTFAIGSFAFAREIRTLIEASQPLAGRALTVIGPEPEGHRSVSVIVCTHGDRLESFEMLVAALESQSMDFELVVVLGRASERLRRSAYALADRARVVECPEPNVSRARNTGIRAAGGDIVVFIDDDALPVHREWLTRLTSPLMSPGRIAATGGAVLSGQSERVEFHGGATSSGGFHRFGPPDQSDEPPPDGTVWWPGVPGGNCAFVAAALREAGGFDEQYSYYLDETDVCVRLSARGYGVIALEDAAIRHYPGPSVHGPARRRSRRLIARSDGYFVMRHAEGSKARRALRAVAYLTAKPYFREGMLRRQARQLSTVELITHQANCAIGLVAGIWAGRHAAALGEEGRLQPAFPWQAFPRRAASSPAIVAVTAYAEEDAPLAMAAATALYRAGHEVSLLTSEDAGPSAPPIEPPPEFAEMAEVWEAACLACRRPRAAAGAPAGPVAEVVIGSELAARLRAVCAPGVIHLEPERSRGIPASGPVGRWLCLGGMSGREPERITADRIVPALARVLADTYGRPEDTSFAPAGATIAIARLWLARLRDDREREPATPWPFRMTHTWTAALALVRHCLIEQEPQLALDLASIHAPNTRVADPAMAAEFDYHAARALRALRRDDEAWPLYERIVGAAAAGGVSGPIHAGACYHLAVAAEAEGRAERARDLLMECVRVQPEHGAAQRLLEQLRQREASAA